MALNRVLLQGRLTSDPEIRNTQSGISVASFSLAVERDFKDKETGERGVDFFRCTAWRGTADFVSNWFHKGDLMVLDGKLQQNRYTDNDGNNRSSTEVVADSVYFGSSKKDGESGGSSRDHSDGDAHGTANENVGGFQEITDGSEDELPF